MAQGLKTRLDISFFFLINYYCVHFRTHSIILVDQNNKVTYHEKTLAFPIDEKNKQWEDSVYEFELL